MALIEQVTQTITYALTSDLSEFISDHFGLDANEVSAVVRDYLGHNSISVSPERKTIAKVAKKSPPIKAATSGTKTCQFRLTRGDREGKLCGTTVRSGGDFCSKHKNRKAAQAITTKKTGNNITRDTKAKCWVISGTKFAVKSSQNKTVVGKIAGTKVVPLTKADKKKVAEFNVSIESDDC